LLRGSKEFRIAGNKQKEEMRKRSSALRSTEPKKSAKKKEGREAEGREEGEEEHCRIPSLDAKRAVMLALLGMVLLVGTAQYYIAPSIKSGMGSLRTYRRVRNEKCLQKAGEEGPREEKKTRGEEEGRRAEKARERERLGKLKERAEELKAILREREEKQKEESKSRGWSMGHLARGAKTFFNVFFILLVFSLTILATLQLLHMRYAKKECVNEYIAYLKNDIKRRAKTKTQPLPIEEQISGLALLSNKDRLKVKKAICRDSNIQEISILVSLQKHKAWQWIGPQEALRPR
jgi:hypothetical protein